MKFAPHRSLTFWSGILVMGFICWAWRDSRQQLSTAWSGYTSVTNLWGGVRIAHKTLGRPLKRQIHFEPANLGGRIEQKMFPRVLFLRPAELSPELVRAITDVAMGNREAITSEENLRMNMTPSLSRPEGWALFIPHWLLLLVVAVPWAGGLYWRARRRKRIGMS